MPKKYFKAHRNADNGQFMNSEDAKKKPKSEVIEEKVLKSGYGVENKRGKKK